MNNTKISLLGGDMRQLVLAHCLSQCGYEIALWGLPRPDSTDTVSAYCGDCNGVRCVDPESAIQGCKAVILPLPVTSDGVRIHTMAAETDAPEQRKDLRLTRLMELLPKNTILLAGKPNEVLKAMARDENVRLIDYYDCEEIQIKNAVPTVEGAISIAMKLLPITIFGSHCTILGYGRIGKRLADVLLALGAKVTVCARSEKDLANARIAGCTVYSLADYLSEPTQTNIIFNTIPAVILNGAFLNKISDSTLIIELASPPGCMDARTLKSCRQSVVKASSLPGKTAPISAGKILFETIVRILEKEGVTPQ